MLTLMKAPLLSFLMHQADAMLCKSLPKDPDKGARIRATRPAAAMPRHVAGLQESFLSSH